MRTQKHHISELDSKARSIRVIKYHCKQAILELDVKKQAYIGH